MPHSLAGAKPVLGSDARFFGQFLVDMAVISADQLSMALEHLWRVNRCVGQLAVDAGLVTDAQADHINRLQQRIDSRWGDIAISLGLLKRRQIADLLAKQSETNLHLGDVLIKLGYLQFETLRRGRSIFESSEAARRISLSIPEALRQDAAISDLIVFVPRLFRRVARLIVKLDAVEEDMPDETRFSATIHLVSHRTCIVSLMMDAGFAEALTRGMWSWGQGVVIGEDLLREATEEFVTLLGRYAKAQGELRGQPTSLYRSNDFQHRPGDPACVIRSPAGSGYLKFHFE